MDSRPRDAATAGQGPGALEQAGLSSPPPRTPTSGPEAFAKEGVADGAGCQNRWTFPRPAVARVCLGPRTVPSHFRIKTQHFYSEFFFFFSFNLQIRCLM